MKMIIRTITLCSLTSLFALTACTTNTQSQNTTAGTIAGAVLGGLAGSTIGQGTGQLAAIGVGAIAGGLLGNAIGHNMEHADTQNMNNTLDHNSVRKTSKWTNKKTGAKYTMTPMSRTMSYAGFNICRKYRSTITQNGQREVVDGIACRQENGDWAAMKT